MVETLLDNRKDFSNTLTAISQVFTSNAVVWVWDTENDGVGGCHTLAKTRQWSGRNYRTGVNFKDNVQETFNFQRRLGDGKKGNPPNPEYSDDKVRLELLPNVDFMIAFEPANCDSNRLIELLGLEIFQRYRHKFIDFQRKMYKPIATTKSEIKNKLYTTAMAQWDIYPKLFFNNPKLAKKFEAILLPIDAKGDGKCFTDVFQLTNLVKIWEICLFSDLSALGGGGRCTSLQPIISFLADFLTKCMCMYSQQCNQS